MSKLHEQFVNLDFEGAHVFEVFFRVLHVVGGGDCAREAGTPEAAARGHGEGPILTGTGAFEVLFLWKWLKRLMKQTVPVQDGTERCVWICLSTVLGGTSGQVIQSTSDTMACQLWRLRRCSERWSICGRRTWLCTSGCRNRSWHRPNTSDAHLVVIKLMLYVGTGELLEGMRWLGFRVRL